MNKRVITILGLLLSIIIVSAQVPSNYYSTCEGKKGQALLVELFNVIGNHEVVSYKGLWDVYRTSDVRSDGTIWDMYSTKHWSAGSEQCGNYSSVGDCYNREHSFPKSWFNDASPMYSDAFHVYPTDGKVNGQRSNYPYGECEGGTTLSASGGVKALGRLGTSTFAGYSGTVFEPDDEYKGDFARSYFYMAACYNDRIASWDSPMLSGNSYPAYTQWAVNLLLKWHRQDPVSQKELDRNEVIYSYQNNRNPFIDYPDLAEHIWGDKTSQEWYSTDEVTPMITFPVDGSVLNMGVTATNVALEKELIVKGVALNENVSVIVSGAGFSASTTSLGYAQVNAEGGASVMVKYYSSIDAESEGKLTLTSGDVVSVVNLKARALSSLYALNPTEVDETSFLAHWVNVNSDDPSATYLLSVYNNAAIMTGYPIEVKASDEKYKVESLEPSTTYSYKIAYGTLTSNEVSVTTSDPVQFIQFINDGAIELSATIGEMSQDVEVGVDTWYVDGDITISVGMPFELSVDKNNWNSTITLSSEESHFYIRLRGEAVGEYASVITATSAVCDAEPLDVTGVVSHPSMFYEDFEMEGDDTYSAHDYIGDAAQWRFSDAGIWSSDAAYSGEQAVRFGKTSSSYIAMSEDKNDGMGVVSFYAKQWSSSDGAAVVNVEYSTDGGSSWVVAGEVTIDQSSYTQYSVNVNKTGSVRLRLSQKSGKRFMLDALEVGNYGTMVEHLNSGDWTAYCYDGCMIIESEKNYDIVKVYDMKGDVTYSSSIKEGVTQLKLPQGLYIVVVGENTRKVLIK